MRKITYTAEPETDSERLDSYISSKSGLSRAYVQRLIKEDMVTVNYHHEKASYRIRHGDKIEVTTPEETAVTLTPEDIPLNVLYEDEYIIVVNKPHGMVVYPAPGHSGGTLLNAVISRCKKLASHGGPLRPGIVHRLDKDTSGVMVIAKNDMAYLNLCRQFKDRSVEKHYLSLVYGNLKREHGEIRSLIGRSSSDRKKMSTRTGKGKEAITEFKVIKRLKSADLVDVKILTGRTHQIRVHFASLGHPVLGDKIYGSKTSIRLGQRVINFSRQMLHAHSLKFSHPADGRPLEFMASMPEDMESAARELTF
ncbi:MAG: RluA family pseudouridine synthase [Nitrospirae bacterium]|nr:RluA family pseudouridine synthase [Nitrospirota bacterium]